MQQKTISGFKLLSEDELEAAHRLRKRHNVRVISAAALSLLGIVFLVMTSFPLILNQAMPIFWVNEADQLGLTESLREIGLRLLANGRIETLPPAFSWILGSIAGVLFWLSHLFYINRNEAKWYGTAFSLSYWTTFYPVKNGVKVHRVHSKTKHKAPEKRFVFKDPSQT